MNWIKKLSGLEITLSIICVGLLTVVITLSLRLRSKFAPLATDWGTVAEWSAVAVTFFGFVGAFGALMLQRRSVSIQVDQHLADIAAAEAAARAELVAEREANRKEAEAAKQKREKYVSGLELKLFAKYKDKLVGQEHPHDNHLTLAVRATINSKLSHSDVKLRVPTSPDFDVRVDHFSETKSLPTSKGNPWMEWQIKTTPNSDPVFDGDDRDDKALDWLKEQVSLDFTDPAGVRWRKDGHGNFDELTAPIEIRDRDGGLAGDQQY